MIAFLCTIVVTRQIAIRQRVTPEVLRMRGALLSLAGPHLQQKEKKKFCIPLESETGTCVGGGGKQISHCGGSYHQDKQDFGSLGAMGDTRLSYREAFFE